MPFVTSDPNRVTLNLLGLKISLAKAKLWDNLPGPYNLHALLKEYGRIRYWFPGIVVQHGWTPRDDASPNDVHNATRLMLCLSKRYQKQFQAKSSVRCEIAGSPFAHYRRLHNIEIAPDAKGTIAFPAHSTPGLYAEFDHGKYCAELRALPEKFQPVTLCLHPADITHFHLDETYKSLGFPVVSAGMVQGKPFHEAYYDILRRHRFATSNEVGSYTFYAVEMGIPFFLLGEHPQIDNRTTKNIDLPPSVLRSPDFYQAGKVAAERFSGGPTDHISPLQQEYVLDELGINDCLSPEALHAVIIDITRQLYYRNSPTRQALLALSMMIRYPLACAHMVSFFATVWRECRRTD